MGFFDRIRLAAAALTGKVTASWNWRGGTKPGHLFDGSKFNGALIYPGVWGQDTQVLRERSRVAYWESTQARALLGRLVSNVIGTGLSLECSPIWALIGDQGLDEAGQHAKAREIELRFHLWAASHEADASERMSLYELQAYEFLNRLRDGETFMVLRYSGDTSRQSPVSIQFISPCQVTTPTDKITLEATKTAGRRIVDGIEIDAAGRELAIHVCDEDGRTWTRIPMVGPSGRRFVVHTIVTDTLGAVRGTPILAPMVHELQKITDYTVAEIEAAVINAIMAVWIEPSDKASASQALSGIRTRNASAAEAAGDNGTAEATFDKPGLIIQTLKAGEKIQSFDTKRPNVNFGEFVRHITRHLSASIGVPIEILEESFNANYSASRASILLFWTEVQRWREIGASQFLNIVYEAWFAEEVKASRISAPGFAGSSPVIRRAWLNCGWLGINKPSIDPQKEAAADDLRIAQGSTTRERVAVEYNGSDAMDNIKRLAIENAALAAANKSLQPPTPVAPAAPGSTREDTNEDSGEEADE